LLPANSRYGGLEQLMESLRYYIDTVGRRVTLEWALIEGENDTPETAHALGKLIQKWLPSKGKINNMVHVNVIPLNPTGGYSGAKPSNRQRVRDFCDILQDKYGVSCTPRVRRGIDIDAGCGQLTTKVLQKEKSEEIVSKKKHFDDDEEMLSNVRKNADEEDTTSAPLQWTISEDAVLWKDDDDEEESIDEDDEDWYYEYRSPEELDEVKRLVKLVEDTARNNRGV